MKLSFRTLPRIVKKSILSDIPSKVILNFNNIYLIYSFAWEVFMGAKLFQVGCHIWDQLAYSLGCLIYQYLSICWINDATISRHQSFIKILNEKLIRYLMMSTLNTQLLKSFPILEECLSMILLNPTFISLCWQL